MTNGSEPPTKMTWGGFGRTELIIHGVLTVLTLGLWLPVVLVITLWKRGGGARIASYAVWRERADRARRSSVIGRRREKAPPDEHVARIHAAIDEKIASWPMRGGSGGSRVLERGLYKYLPRLIDPDEEVIAVGTGWFSETFWGTSKNKRQGDSGLPKSGYVALTDRRLHLISTAIAGLGSRGTETIVLDRILSVDGSRWIGQGVLAVGAPIRVNTGGGEIAFRVHPTRVADEMVAYIRAHIAGATVSPSRESTTTVLAQLGDLHKGGVLTDEEFAAKKAELLERI